MNKKILQLLTALIIVTLAGSIIISIYIRNGEKKEVGDGSQISAVTSFYPTYIIALNITDQIPELKVNSLTDFSAGCLHDYQLTTGDMKLLSKADVFLMNGGGMEGYLEDVVKNYPDLDIVNISKDIPMLESDVHGHEDHDHENEEHEDENEENDHENNEHEEIVNPHVWLDPTLYADQIRNMEEGLIQYVNSRIDMTEEQKDQIIQKLRDNADTYLEKVSVLEEELNHLVTTIKESNKNRQVVIFHETFAYLAHRVDLEVAHTVEIDSDVSLSAGEIAEVIDIVKKEHIEYLFTEEQFGDSITDRIEEETGAIAYIIDSAVTGDGGKDSYLEAMTKNIEILKEVFE